MWFVVAWCGLSLHGKTDPTPFFFFFAQLQMHLDRTDNATDVAETKQLF